MKGPLAARIEISAKRQRRVETEVGGKSVNSPVTHACVEQQACHFNTGLIQSYFTHCACVSCYWFFSSLFVFLSFFFFFFFVSFLLFGRDCSASPLPADRRPLPLLSAHRADCFAGCARLIFEARRRDHDRRQLTSITAAPTLTDTQPATADVRSSTNRTAIVCSRCPPPFPLPPWPHSQRSA